MHTQQIGSSSNAHPEQSAQGWHAFVKLVMEMSASRSNRWHYTDGRHAFMLPRVHFEHCCAMDDMLVLQSQLHMHCSDSFSNASSGSASLLDKQLPEAQTMEVRWQAVDAGDSPTQMTRFSGGKWSSRVQGPMISGMTKAGNANATLPHLHKQMLSVCFASKHSGLPWCVHMDECCCRSPRSPGTLTRPNSSSFTVDCNLHVTELATCIIDSWTSR